ncbi:hypothetical protein ABEB36_007906 [Hypothenemus hampei]|uniref:Fatty acyl-CoA reductase n=1 Tax=Hypothenemus hampei TaxID=57062 RepID=A0ABD1EVI8_HYPHA
MERVELTEIQRFYKDSTVFLTGATGFIGKLLLEKILRSLPVKKVFILIRIKKDTNVNARWEQILDSPIFDGLKRNSKEVFQKVAIFKGDCNQPNLGMSPEDIAQFINEVNVVFHCAANVRFDASLKETTITNIRATRDLIEIAKQVKKLKTFVYIGTGFSNCNRLEIKEEIYPSRISGEDLIQVCESLDDESIKALRQPLCGEWPNTYTFTKHVTEDYLSKLAKDLPVCITRPTIVISTSEEPVAAFCDSVFTLAGFFLTTALGFCRIVYYKKILLDVVPADIVVNQCIVTGWHTGETFKKGVSEIPIYNISSVEQNPVNQDDVYAWSEASARQIPSERIFAYPFYFRTTCKYNYLFTRIFLHTFFAWVLDLTLRVQGKQPMFSKGMKKLHAFHEAYEFFSTTQFSISVDNTLKLLKRMSFADKQMFNCDIKTIDWESYFTNYVKGLRCYLVKDPMDTIPQGRKHYNKLRNLFIFLVLSLIIMLYIVGKVVLFKMLPLLFGIMIYILRGMICSEM